MPGPPSSKIAWMAYLLAGVAGWELVASSHPYATTADAHRKRATRTERGASTSGSGAQELLARLEAECQAVSGAIELELNDNLREMIAKRLAEMPLTTDPAASAPRAASDHSSRWCSPSGARS